MSGKMPLETRNSTIATAGEVISAGCRILPRLNQLRKQITLYISNIWFTAVILIASLGHSNDLAAKIGVCQAHDYINVFASSSPDLGGIEPATLVTIGTKVQLLGIAEKDHISPQCITQVLQQLPFEWEVIFQSPDGNSTKINVENPKSLNPTFDAKEKGNYFVTFTTLTMPSESVKIKIEAIGKGRSWFSIGPSGLREGFFFNPDVGRVNTLAFHPAGNGIVYAGSALGGVFKSTDLGHNWFPVTDHKGLPTLAIGALAVSADGTIYAGTGDSHPNSGFSKLWQSGSGIWKSSDAGATWQPAGQKIGACDNSIAFSGTATKIVADPQNPNIIYAASDQGVLRSVDAGNCWSRVFAKPVTDIVLDSTETHSNLYAAKADGQNSLVVNNIGCLGPNNCFFNVLPVPILDNYDGVVLAVAPTDVRTLYFAFATSARTDFFKSVDGGAHWTQGKSTTQCANQCPYDMAIAVSPNESTRVFYGDRYAWQSVNGTQSWLDLRNKDGGHTDYHGLVFSPSFQIGIYAANDGGVYRINTPASRRNPTPILGWQPLNQGLSIAQAPGLAISPTEPN
jgi:hypothetical protein